MEIPIPYIQWDTPKNKTFDWKTIESIERKPYNGTVYSLDVEFHHHYIADGIITHNCLYGWKDGAAHFFIDDRCNTTVIEDHLDIEKMTKPELKAALKDILQGSISTSVIHEDKPSRSEEHPTMKPIKLIARHLKNSSKRGQIVLDTFGGSGTTLITAEQLGRICYMAENDPIYCDVIIARYEKYTGQKAALLSKI